MKHIDLNLIRTFVVLYETKSVTKTADQLSITQPSVSYALSKLRHYCDDPLFIRQKTGMAPTPTATELFATLKESLNDIDRSFETINEFVPSTTTREFKISLTDLGEMVQLPLIYQTLKDMAPSAKLHVSTVKIETMIDRMLNGDVDCVICSSPINDSAINQHPLHCEKYVCIAGEKFDGKRLTLKKFENSNHIKVSRELGHGIIDDVIEEKGLQRNSVLSVPHFSSLPYVLMKTDLISIVPSMIGEYYQKQYRLKMFALPFESPEINIRVYWARRLEKSPAHKWFVQTVINALSQKWM